MKVHPQVTDHPAPGSDYTRAISFRLVRLLTLMGVLTFQDLVRLAEGAYPSDVLFSLQSLEKAGEICRVEPDSWSKRITPSRPSRMLPPSSFSHSAGASDGLPEPHPIDFDWRFTDETLSDLERYIHPAPAQRVAVLGAPTLFGRLSRSGVIAHLFDRNPHIVEHFTSAGHSSVTQCDLFDFSDFSMSFQWVVADPPWYIEHYYAFIEASSKLLESEGKLLLSVLPRLTRPSAPEDRINIIEAATRSGLDLVEVRPGALHYVSPPFELEALHAEGLTLDDWRSGDLFCFTLRCHALQQRASHAPAEQETWQTLQLGATIIKIKQEERPESEPFDYRPVSPTGGLRLRSVSRRSPVRPQINLWSSRNIALTVSKPVALVEALEKLGTGHPLDQTLASIAYEYQLSNTESSRLRELLAILLADAGMTWRD